MKWRANKITDAGPNPTTVRGSLQEGKLVFVQLSGNIQSYDEAAVLFPPVKSILQMIFSLPSELALIISVSCHMCSFAVAVVYQLSVPESCFMSSKTSES